MASYIYSDTRDEKIQILSLQEHISRHTQHLVLQTALYLILYLHHCFHSCSTHLTVFNTFHRGALNIETEANISSAGPTGQDDSGVAGGGI